MGDASHRPSILIIPTAYSQPCYNHALDEPNSCPASVHICYVTKFHVEEDTFTCTSNTPLKPTRDTTEWDTDLDCKLSLK